MKIQLPDPHLVFVVIVLGGIAIGTAVAIARILHSL